MAVFNGTNYELNDFKDWGFASKLLGMCDDALVDLQAKVAEAEAARNQALNSLYWHNLLLNSSFVGTAIDPSGARYHAPGDFAGGSFHVTPVFHQSGQHATITEHEIVPKTGDPANPISQALIAAMGRDSGVSMGSGFGIAKITHTGAVSLGNQFAIGEYNRIHRVTPVTMGCWLYVESAPGGAIWLHNNVLTEGTHYTLGQWQWHAHFSAGPYRKYWGPSCLDGGVTYLACPVAAIGDLTSLAAPISTVPHVMEV